MKLDSKYFDCIRVKPEEDRLASERLPRCQWKGCGKAARHRAPMGRGREGQYFDFCLEHVRRYNKSYNYFEGMSDEDIAFYQKASLTGHRPTWAMGTPSGADAGPRAAGTGGFRHAFSVDDLFGLFGRGTAGEAPRAYRDERPLRRVERKSLNALHLDETATASEIKARYKTLVKRLHPDRNGGDRRAEDKLREVIQAYTYLRQAGLC